MEFIFDNKHVFIYCANNYNYNYNYNYIYNKLVNKYIISTKSNYY